MKKKALILIVCFPMMLFAQEDILPMENTETYFEKNNGFHYPFTDTNTIEKNVPAKNVHYGLSAHQFIRPLSFLTSFLFTLNYKKHQFDVGPTFQLGRTINKFNKDFGVEFNYRYYPNGDETKFSSFMLFNFNYFHNHSQWTTTIYNPTVSELHDKEADIKEINHDLAFHWGYGVKFKFVKGFYISSNVGLGFVNLVSVTERMLANTENIYSDSKWNSREFSFVFGISLGYKF